MNLIENLGQIKLENWMKFFDEIVWKHLNDFVEISFASFPFAFIIKWRNFEAIVSIKSHLSLILEIFLVEFIKVKIYFRFICMYRDF